MRIRVEFENQVRVAAGVRHREIEVGDNASVRAVLQSLASDPEAFLRMWLDGEFRPRNGLLLFVNDSAVVNLDEQRLRENDRLSLVSLVSGG